MENDEGSIVKDHLREGHTYTCRLILLNSFCQEGIWLLVKTVEQIIAPYGSIGGKMPNKPSEYAFDGNPLLAGKQSRNHHLDFGLIEILEISGLPPRDYSRAAVTDFLRKYEVTNKDGVTRQNDPDWPSLNHFFSVKANASRDCFHRRDINMLIGENPDNPSAIGYCLKGRRGSRVLPAKSKDIFAFKSGLIWGYCRDDTVRNSIMGEIKSNLNRKRPPILITEQVVGSQLVDKLFKKGEEDHDRAETHV
jgi:hypothetical protein